MRFTAIVIHNDRRGTNALLVHLVNISNRTNSQPTSETRCHVDSEYLRRQADNCLRIARDCFDLATAERLRLMAAELQAKAERSRSEDDRRPRLDMIARQRLSPRSNGDSSPD